MTIFYRSDVAVDVTALLLTAPDSASRAALVASAIVEQIPDSACAVHRFVTTDGDAAWTAIGVAGDVTIEKVSIPPESRLITPLLAELPQAVIYPAAKVRREDYSHLHVSRSIASLAYLPLLHNGQLTGALEILSFSAALQPKDLEEIAPIAQLASPAILAAEEFEQQRQTLLDSVHRMSQLYDLEKSLNSTLELDAVIALIPVKASAMLACRLFISGSSTVRYSACFQVTVRTLP